MTESNGTPLEIAHGIIRGGVSNLLSQLTAVTKETPDGRDLVDIDPIKVLTDLTEIIDRAHADIIKETQVGKSFDEATNSKTLIGPELVPLIDTKVEYIIEPLCPVATLTLIQGMPKSGKSTFSLWMALCASIGLPPGEMFKIAKPRKVLLVEFEDNPILVAKRASRYLSGAGWDGYEIPETFSLCDSPTLWLETKKYEDLLTSEIQAKGYELVIIDTLSYVHNMDDENASAQMKMVMAALKRIVKATNCSIVMIHHSGKGKQNGSAVNEKARGSSAISAAADVIVDWGDRQGTDTTPVQVISKYDDAFDLSVEYKRTQEGIQWVITKGESTKGDDSNDKILSCVRELLLTSPTGISGVSVFKALEQQGFKKSNVYYHLGKLSSSGKLMATTKGRETIYSIPRDF